MFRLDWNDSKNFQTTLTCPTCNGVMGLVQNMDGAVFVCVACSDVIPAIDTETITE